MTQSSYSDWMGFLQDIMGSHEIQSLRPFLARARDLFQMGSGFVYEADHTGLLHLRDYQSDYGVKHLPRQLNLRSALGVEQFLEFCSYPVMARFHQQGNALGNSLCKVFSAQAYILAPIIEESGELTGLIGFADRRTTPEVIEEDLGLLELILSAFISKIRLRRYQEGLEASRQVLSDVLDSTGVDIYVVDFFTYEVLYCNKTMAAPYGGLDKLIGKRCWQALYDGKTEPCDFCPAQHLLDEQGNPNGLYSWDYQRPFDKSWFRVLTAAFRWSDGRLALLVTSVDITENKQNEELIRKLANTDAITGLFSRIKLHSDLEEQWKVAGEYHYVMFCDLNDFKLINDKYGHNIGDELLTGIGAFLRDNLPGCSVYRYGGDEILIHLLNGTEEQIAQVQSTITTRFAQPWQTTSGELPCTVSIGTAESPNDAETLDQVIHLADEAMYCAKQDVANSIYAYARGKMEKIR